MSTKKENALSIKNNKLVFTAQDKNESSTDDEWTFTLKIAPGPAAIVYPSLCSPLIKSSKEPLRIYVLTDDAFKQTYDTSAEVAKQIVNTYLKFEPWADYRAGQQSVQQNQRPAPKDEPLCKTWQDANKDITVTLLDAGDYNNGHLKNQDQQLFAMLHPNARQWYGKHQLKHLFRIDIAAQNPKVRAASDKQLWALSWRVPSPKDTGTFEQYHDKLIQEYNQRYVSPREQQILAYKIGPELTFEQDKATPLQSHHPVYIFDGNHLNLGQLTDVHVSSRQHVFDKGKPRVIDGVSEVIGTHVNKAYTPLKNLMDHFGSDGDVHLLVFTGDLVDYGRNFDPASAKGRAISTSANLWEVMDLDLLSDESLYPRYIDLRIMYSLFINYYDRFKKPLLLVSGNHEGYTAPYGISPRVTKSEVGMGILSGAWSKVKNGIRNGWNTIAFWDDDPDSHEMRDLSEVMKSEAESRKQYVEKNDEVALQGGTLANEGVPADHNLTMYEACLLYGPDYGRVVMAGGSANADNTNFNPENFRWFYMLFTPVTDLWIKIGQQTLIGLNWGEGEQMTHLIDGPTKNSEVRAALEKEGRIGFAWTAVGILPQSTESLTDDQVGLVKAALTQKSTTNVLCAHFTIANFDPSFSYEIKDEKSGKYVPRQAPVSVGGAASRQVTTHYNTGTFQENRRYLLQECIQQGKIQLTMSGHSHRAGLYQDIGTKPTVSQSLLGWVGTGEDMVVQPHAPRPDGRYDYQAKPDKGLFLVSASGGSIPVQNYRGEMMGFGMAPPSGSAVKFGGAKPEIQVIEYNKGSAKPRFCVAMDFMDVLGPGATIEKEGVFERFECEEEIDDFTDQLELLLQLNQRRFPDVPVFKAGRLHIFLRKEETIVTLPFSVRHEGKRLHKGDLKNIANFFRGRSSLQVLSQAAKDEENRYFVELSFDSSHLLNQIGFRQYNFDSPWYIQMQLKPREIIQATVRGTRRKAAPGFRLERDEKFGKVPSFDWRSTYYPGEYMLPAKYDKKPK